MTNIETLLLRKLDELIFLNKNDGKIVKERGDIDGKNNVDKKGISW